MAEKNFAPPPLATPPPLLPCLGQGLEVAVQACATLQVCMLAPPGDVWTSWALKAVTLIFEIISIGEREKKLHHLPLKGTMRRCEAGALARSRSVGFRWECYRTRVMEREEERYARRVFPRAWPLILTGRAGNAVDRRARGGA